MTEENLLKWLSEKFAHGITRLICKGYILTGDGKSLFTDRDREQMRQFLAEHKN